MKADKRTCTPPHRFTDFNWLRLCCRVMLAGGLLLGSAAHADEGLLVRLPAPRLSGTVPLESVLQQRQSVREFRKARLTLAEVSQLLWAAQGITRTGGRRTAPSAGALYPLELYLVAGQVEGLAAGVYRYDPARHGLSSVQNGDARERLAKAAVGQSSVKKAPVVLAIAGVYARTAGKYGARAERYVWIEAGHAGQNVYLQAQTLGLGTVMVGAFDDRAVQGILGLPPDHVPLALMPVGRR
ncbi:SagB-type dehydrogenase domain-containing protein [Formivibrio citricus]|uniref:SagB-type dehydrogenase domain-containing protein n=1 Tax=Formivibrio citricus TaxID=83765 RepID=A0A1I4VRY4_9NEIS|nr:SagB/ThcOx family dehydrogenase [Formivibrio citricus]SFN04051.1 SagB-type dehydrogenase domain-containing protein [Formivibrio citricus]